MSREIPKHVAEAMKVMSNFCNDFTTVECQRGDCPFAYGNNHCLLKKIKVDDWADQVEIKHFVRDYE